MPLFKKHERLCSKKFLDKLFAEGKSILLYPIKLTFLELNFENSSPAQVLFIVPKKRFKRANKRNLIRRRMREVYRLIKDEFYNNLNNNNVQMVITISYVANEILISDIIKAQMAKGLKNISKTH